MQWRLSFPVQVGMAFVVGFLGLVPVVIERAGATDRAAVAVEAESLVRSPIDDVVKVTNRTCDGGELIGTGTLLDDGRVLTAAHVVAGAEQVTIAWEGSPSSVERVTGIAVAGGDDLAVLRLDGGPGVGIGRPVAAVDPAIGADPLTIAGHPDGGAEAVRLAHADHYLPGRDANDPPTLLRLDAESHPGDSGGPVLDRRGAVAAMVLSRETVTGLALTAPASVLRAGIAGAVTVPIGSC